MVESLSELDSIIWTSLSGLKLGRWNAPPTFSFSFPFPPLSLPFPFEADFVTLLLDAEVKVGFDFVGLVLGFEVDDGLEAEGRGGLNGFGGIASANLWFEGDG